LSSPQTEPRWTRWLEWAILIAIVALAAFLRYWRLEEVPPGFNSDEAVGAMGGLTTLREGLRYSYEGQGGGGALGFYFVAASFYLFGPSIAAARGIAAWAGVVSVFANYWAVQELFRLEGFTRARILAGLSTLGLALSFWHIQASRVVFAGIGVPFLMLPSVYFLWLGLNQTPLPSQGRGWGGGGPPAVAFCRQWHLPGGIDVHLSIRHLRPPVLRCLLHRPVADRQILAKIIQWFIFED
jgi:4-amino-4-deoxy-L-arabinose transferase-like glycosyltransferase